MDRCYEGLLTSSNRFYQTAPWRLLLVPTGNIAKEELISSFHVHHQVDFIPVLRFIELDRTSVVRLKRSGDPVAFDFALDFDFESPMPQPGWTFARNTIPS